RSRAQAILEDLAISTRVTFQRWPVLTQVALQRGGLAMRRRNTNTGANINVENILGRIGLAASGYQRAQISIGERIGKIPQEDGRKRRLSEVPKAAGQPMEKRRAAVLAMWDRL